MDDIEVAVGVGWVTASAGDLAQDAAEGKAGGLVASGDCGPLGEKDGAAGVGG